MTCMGIFFNAHYQACCHHARCRADRVMAMASSAKDLDCIPVPSVVATLLDPCKAQLGECPIWDNTTQSILWIDIEGK